MKYSLLFLIVFSLLISCSDNSVAPTLDVNEFNLNEEAANFSWELVTGKIAYNRLKVGVILVDCENRKMKILKILPYLNMMTWYYDKTKITGVDIGIPSFLGSEGRPAKFYCIDFEGNNSFSEYSFQRIHSWSNGGKIAHLSQETFFSPNLFINSQLFISNQEYSLYLTRPTWSPDEKYLVVSAGVGFSDTTYSELKKFDIISKQETTVVTADSIGFNYGFYDPIYSADGSRIAYAYRINNIDVENNYMQEIYIINSDGSNKMKLTTGYVDSFPAWSPDGQKLIFQRNTIENPDKDSEGIFIINVDGSGLQKILSNGSDMPIWM